MENNLVIMKQEIRDFLFDLLHKTPNVWASKRTEVRVSK